MINAKRRPSVRAKMLTVYRLAFIVPFLPHRPHNPYDRRVVKNLL